MKKLLVVKIVLSVVYVALILLMVVSLVSGHYNQNAMHSEQEVEYELAKLLTTIIITAVLIVMAISLLIVVIVRYKKRIAEEQDEIEPQPSQE